MESAKTLEGCSYSVKSPELAAGGWRSVATEQDPVDRKRRSKRSHCNSNAHYLRASKERSSDAACPKAIEQREEARADPRRPQSLKDKLKRLKTLWASRMSSGLFSLLNCFGIRNIGQL